MARVARFYGFGHNEIIDMDVESFLTYLECIDILEAKETLVAIERTSFPHLKPKAKRKLGDKIRKRASKLEEKKVVTNDQLFQMLGNLNGN